MAYTRYPSILVPRAAGGVCGDCCWPAPGGKCDCGGCFFGYRAAKTLHGVDVHGPTIALSDPKVLIGGLIAMLAVFWLGTQAGPLH